MLSQSRGRVVARHTMGNEAITWPKNARTSVAAKLSRPPEMIARPAVLAALVAGLTLGAAPQRGPETDVFASFWVARDPDAAARTTDTIEKSGATFAEVLQRLKRGRPYARDVETGAIQRVNGPDAGGSLNQSQRTRAGEFRYTIEVPTGYDATRRYPVRIHLHGGVMRDPSAVRTPAGIGSLAGTKDQIYILPVGSSAAPWWGRAQIENLRAILDSVKRTYNVDENRVTVSGVSDGGTGAFYVAMADTTPYSAFVSLNGFVIVLRSERLVDGDLFPNNLRAKPWYVVNGGRDRLYPTSMVEPFLSHLFRGGVSIEYRPQPEAGHETSWWPKLKDEVDAFLGDHPRAPLPDKLSWEASDLERGRPPVRALAGNRRAGRDPHRRAAAGRERARGRAEPAPDVRTPAPARPRRSRPDRQPRPGRHLRRPPVHAASVTRPVRLRPAGARDGQWPPRLSKGRVEPSTKTLLKWAARDNDRTMLFGAEISIRP